MLWMSLEELYLHTMGIGAKLKRVFGYNRRVKCIAMTVVLGLLLCIILLYHARTGQGGIQVYDLTWPDKTDANRPVFRRWRYFIEAKINLPRKVEKYYKMTPEDDYILEETLVVSYPTTEEIKSVIKDAGF